MAVYPPWLSKCSRYPCLWQVINHSIAQHTHKDSIFVKTFGLDCVAEKCCRLREGWTSHLQVSEWDWEACDACPNLCGRSSYLAHTWPSDALWRAFQAERSSNPDSVGEWRSCRATGRLRSPQWNQSEETSQWHKTCRSFPCRGMMFQLRDVWLEPS